MEEGVGKPAWKSFEIAPEKAMRDRGQVASGDTERVRFLDVLVGENKLKLARH